jgi:hypothetical protein
MLLFRTVQQSNHCARDDFRYELKAGQRAAFGRPRPTTYTGTRWRQQDGKRLEQHRQDPD